MDDSNATTVVNDQSFRRLIEGLSRPDAYPEIEVESVEVHQTHISWVFLVGEYAYKIKKPIRTHFLDYSTLEKRKFYCEEEVRLDQRYAAEIYLGVVPVTMHDGRPVVEGKGVPVEYAVKMRRFPQSALLSKQMQAGTLTSDEVDALAIRVAEFHQSATHLDSHLDPGRLGSVDRIEKNAIENLSDLHESVRGEAAKTIQVLTSWTHHYFEKYRRVFSQRVANGFIRECHGDMHLENIVQWNGRLIPFDGIEFNDEFRWIDVISDAAFVAMDFAARGRLDHCRRFINAYLDATGDHASLAVLRWYLVYRSLVRAKVAAIRASQPHLTDSQRQSAMADCEQHVELAYRFSLKDKPALWITHGFSGSGKTTASEIVVERCGAIRLRSDVERKRHFGLVPTERPPAGKTQTLYDEHATQATYARLRRMARCIMRSGYPVIVDATFLRHSQRKMFQSLAQREEATFKILDCHASEQTLRQRIADRMVRDNDASDADLAVLERQLAAHEPLDEQEQELVCLVPDASTAIEHHV
ncbi:MAG: AAA family ATPase [Planctomycetales bacterium]|nr:AAA family ATPase [Planctomycetales bacterium]